MKTFCPTFQKAPKKQPKLYTFDEIRKEEGVYQSSNYTTSRLIVIKNGMNETNVLFFDTQDGLFQPATTLTWQNQKYIKTEEVVYISVK